MSALIEGKFSHLFIYIQYLTSHAASGKALWYERMTIKKKRYVTVIKIILALWIPKSISKPTVVPNYILRTSIVQNSYRQKSHKIGLIIGSPVKIHENIQNCNEIQFKDYIKVTEEILRMHVLYNFPLVMRKEKETRKYI